MTPTPADNNATFAWLDGVAVAATVCDRQGICLYMNEHAARMFAKDGGRALVGKNLIDCHPEPGRSRFAAQLATPTPNTYTVEKNGLRKIIHQIPWFKDGVFSGVAELSFELPTTLPHFVRGTS
jgi:transcriptional regulator with PAS, ATPase and Fis domain